MVVHAHCRLIRYNSQSFALDVAQCRLWASQRWCHRPGRKCRGRPWCPHERLQSVFSALTRESLLGVINSCGFCLSKLFHPVCACFPLPSSYCSRTRCAFNSPGRDNQATVGLTCACDPNLWDRQLCDHRAGQRAGDHYTAGIACRQSVCRKQSPRP